MRGEGLPRTELVPVPRIVGHRALYGREVTQVVVSTEWHGVRSGFTLTYKDGTTEPYYGTRIRRVIEDDS